MVQNSTETRNLHLERKAMWDGSIANHKKFLDPTTGLFKKEFVEDRPCPTCGSLKDVKLFNKSGGTYVRCTACEMVYLNPAFKDSALEEYYRGNHTLQAAIVAQDYGFYRDLYEKGLSGFKGLFTDISNPSILDIGCSAGGFLNIAKEQGWKTHGLEFNQQEAAVSRKSGHDVHEMDLKSFTKTSNAKFNVISLWDVVEHIKNGEELLTLARNTLDKVGGVFLQSPTPTALAARMLQEKCNMFDGLEHVNLYTHENIKHLAKKVGFEVYSYCTVISEKGVIKNHLDYQDPYLGVTDTSIMGEVLTDEYIFRNNLGYKYQIFLKKI
ncbi:MAG TPA: class I SAM-dependent methyltransferase [Bacteriovoracaceae bacterium]|nr:class I SAM-dependent methyltransferase [Bacteriovoracaceae bacterium]